MNVLDLEHIELNAKNPPEEMTDEQWQKYFSAMKSLVMPVSEKKMNSARYSMTVNGRRIDEQSIYDGETTWYRYCQFINTILSAIRRNEKDYCYHIYQITDLLKFEHDRLRSCWMPEYQCFKVWLSNN